MKKTLVSFTISFVCLISFYDFVNADLLPSWNITTGDTNAWKVAKLLQAPDNAVAATRANITETVFKNYLEGYSTVAKPDRTLSRGDALSYGSVKKMENSHPGYGSWDNSITASDARNGSFSNDVGSPGYYAFQTVFSLSPEAVILSGSFLNINLEMRTDDWLEGIFLNGQDITKYAEAAHGVIGSAEFGRILPKLELTGSVLLDDLIEQGLFLTDTANTLEFIIRNVDGSFNGDGPFAFGALGEINIGDQQFAHSFNPTPEPATLLICLTCGGLALAIKRRRKKMMEQNL
ncbi:MAG: hypothetical protein LBP59_12305 [Planctomycetaceae bacterium]|jgi:hypothetical protein|nr:hypothetical protein [Planctomycetaceae bacterium]